MLNCNIALACPRGVVWHFQQEANGPYVWEVVRYEPRGNRSLGIHATGADALAVYRKEVESVTC